MAHYLKVPSKRQTNIIFCIPGPTPGFSADFFQGWTALVIYCMEKGINFSVSNHHSSVVYYARNLCLGGSVTNGKEQKPFNGQIDYTHLMWIDSDVVFNPQQFQALLDYDKDIVSGIYKMGGGNNFATVEEWDEEYFEKNGAFNFWNEEDIKDRTGLIDVAYTGLGWMLIKRGVFEKLKYPWFRPLWKEFGDLKDFTSEDTAFCLMAKEAGFNIYVDPTIRVGHEKTIIY